LTKKNRKLFFNTLTLKVANDLNNWKIKKERRLFYFLDQKYLLKSKRYKKNFDKFISTLKIKQQQQKKQQQQQKLEHFLFLVFVI